MSEAEPAQALPQFALATRSEALRAAQKDAFYCDSLVEQMQAVLSALTVTPWRPAALRAATVLTYFALTTGRGGQTLGEEYCELTQVDASDRLPAAATRRWLGLLVHALVPYWSGRLEARLIAMARRCEEGQQRLLQAVALHLRDVFRVCERLHLAAFYLGGRFLNLGQRVAGLAHIRHTAAGKGASIHGVFGALILARGARSHPAARTRARPLSRELSRLARQAQLAMRALAAVRRVSAARRQARLGLRPAESSESELADTEEPSGDEAAARTCSLCLGPRRHPTATSCGHIFCWNCVHEWLDGKGECPLCRQEITANSLLCLHRYS